MVGRDTFAHALTARRGAIDVGIQVFTSVPDRQIGWRMSGGSPFAGEVTLDLEPLGPDRTRAVWSGSIGLTGLWRLLEPLMASEVKTGEAAELRRLKETLEAAPANASAVPAATSRIP